MLCKKGLITLVSFFLSLLSSLFHSFSLSSKEGGFGGLDERLHFGAVESRNETEEGEEERWMRIVMRVCLGFFSFLSFFFGLSPLGVCFSWVLFRVD